MPYPPHHRRLLALLTLSLAFGCGGDTATGPDPAPVQPTPQVAVVEVTPGADTLTSLGQTRAYVAVARASNGQQIEGVTIAWSSSDNQVAAVSAQGVVTALTNGSTEIRAEVSGVLGAAALSVVQLADDVSVTPSAATLTTVGTTLQFEASAVDANGNELEAAQFLWQSSNHSVATIDTIGRVTGRASGTVVITASAQGVPGHANLSVDQTADRLTFRSAPTGVTAGEALEPAVQVEVVDAEGNRVRDIEPYVTLSLTGGAGDSRLGGTRTVQAVDGVAVFGGLSIERAASDYGLQATAEGIGTATSASFAVASAAPSQLRFVIEPGTAVAGEVFRSQPEVGLFDRFGNPATDGDHTVTVSLDANPGQGSLSGVVSQATSSGVATFSSLSLEKASSGYTLRATARGLSTAISDPFAVTHAVAAKLSFEAGPDVVEGQEPFGLRVSVLDAFDNVVTSASNPVSLTLAADPGGAGIGGRLDATPRSGVASFDGLTLALPRAGYALEATAPGLERASSDAFDVRLTFREVAAAFITTCGITEPGHAYCWGGNLHGALGDGTNSDSAIPVPVAGGQRFETISVAYEYVCGTTLEQLAYCWGANSGGQLGTGDTTPSNVPVPVTGGHRFRTISARANHTCGLTPDGSAYCWGQGLNGQLGNAARPLTQPTPTQVAGDHAFRAIQAGYDNTCAVAEDSSAYCWGQGGAGQNGNNTTARDSLPVLVHGGHEFVAVRPAQTHTCGVTTSSMALCWGSNANGRLGDGSIASDSVPQPVGGGIRVIDISAGRNHSCAVATDGSPFCWGQGTAGQLGNGATTSINTTLTPVAMNLSLTSISAGSASSCARTDVGEVFCWGRNLEGRLGDGTLSGSSLPVRVRH